MVMPAARSADLPTTALHCPYCDSSLEVTFGVADAVPALGPRGIQYGVLRCGCSRYPVVEGIAIIQHRDGLGSVVSAIERGDSHQALLAALNVFRVTWARRSRWAQLRYRIDCKRMIATDRWSFEEAVDRVRRPQVFADYLLHRWANPSFLAAMGPLLLLGRLHGACAVAPSREPIAKVPGTAGTATDVEGIGEASPMVLDLACGAGHSSFVMRSLFPGLKVVSADHDFISLYLAKQFLVPDGIHLCLDAEAPSPFPDACFDAVFCLDAFHYFKSKAAVAREIRRTSRRGSLWLFPHLHNALLENFTPGTPLAPEKYLDVFGSTEGRIFDERAIFHGLIENDRVRLDGVATAEGLASAATLTYVNGPEAIWREHSGFTDALERAGKVLALNPIYRSRKSGGGIELELGWPNAVFEQECIGVLEALPRRLRLSAEQCAKLESAGGWSGDDKLRTLVRRFVLVPLPPHYMAGDGSA